ncbi:flagellar basal body rod protein FlgC [Saccharococcus thermophilus]|jgi:flagellar basal-body rod protein FlgC|uniref:Flagellar basal-body rod protein FlgC n=1 Tax=Saccharococcus thermophilus TaxID=29396 RepID=A0A846MDN2_9BACL|nr:flagellar basal body rod protein FlgC [Saccharococcus thermophilus]NIK14240.1 flagellar basal-body rod protein FlgC [Saccharococcus thermophilus]
MSIFQSLNITASALTAQRLRMDVISSNMANVDTTRARLVNGRWEPYRRKLVVMEPRQEGFATYLQAAMDRPDSVGSGVKVTKIVEDPSPFKLVYDPSHPDAGPDGYVRLPNVDPLKEMVDLIGATRSYEANVTVFNASKGMLMKALEIGK